MTGTVPYQIRSDQSLENNGIDVLRETKVTGIDFLKKQVLIEDRYPLHYDKLLIATGSFANV